VLANGSTLPIMIGAVIYVRVSTKEQTENLSLPTQLRACEEYCRRQGYEILERFHEEGESAKTTDRNQLQNLLTFCRLNKGRVHFVIVFNLTRFARDTLPEFDEMIDRARAQEKTQRILALLPEVYGLALLWRYWEEQSTKEMAAQTGKTEKAMERLLARARAHFRRLWENEGP